ncbi:alpha/beta hydrolase [Massilia sp. Root133]|uniref:Alpha/beta fold hydrolase n=1 Tax=Massilia cellulosiltytica TaxID=2683234 RepID=A0A7X3FWV5_9BURK|nr:MULTISPECIES: alpha/beta hydrolase [Telluria group]KQX98390.1 alpha/beta hydrolase [Massilia sp. Root133]KQZ47076.1 alpha/beta hydrolase [Massilia sp. Root1485]MVW59453.1 alpha/beta fold hydrolase [Telluria cellulosilytica]
MSEPKLKSVLCSSPAGLHRMAYKEWGDPANTNVLVCVHGVTRVADDFDALARAMSDRYRVVCPDVVGRGRSDRLRDPALYVIPQYVADMVTLIARVTAGDEGVAWFGTSMGGLIGIALASLPDSPIRRMVLNDIGPVLDPVALARIGDYIGQAIRFATFAEGAAYVRMVSTPFGPHSDAQWDKLARDVLVQQPDGQWALHYDLGLAQPFKAMTPAKVAQDEARLWAAYDAIRCPTLLVRGEHSDLLSRATADEMTRRGPKPALREIAGVGHAPTFLQPEQIAIAREFLTG